MKPFYHFSKDKMLYLTLAIYLFSITFGAVPKNEFLQPEFYSEAFTYFVNTFLQIVDSSDILKSIFYQAAKETANYDAVYISLLAGAKKYGAADPDLVAKSLAGAAVSVSAKFTTFNLAKIVAVALGQTLNDRHLISTTNAVELAGILADAILNDKVYAEPYPAPHVKALSDGALKVVQILKIESPKTAADFTQYLIKGFLDLNKSY